jgi:hypothetical protein
MTIYIDKVTLIDYRGCKYLRYNEKFYKLNKRAYKTISEAMEHSSSTCSIDLSTTVDKVLNGLLIMSAIYLSIMVGKVILQII